MEVKMTHFKRTASANMALWNLLLLVHRLLTNGDWKNFLWHRSCTAVVRINNARRDKDDKG
jgi:hypothetical protein